MLGRSGIVVATATVAVGRLSSTMSDYPSLGGMRAPYKASQDVLREEELPTRKPIELFSKWFKETVDSGTMYETNAMAVASTTPDGVPSVRMVLLKGFDEKGFVFYTNYESRKGRELLCNPRAALLFYWEAMHRQVRIEGHIEKTSRENTQNYFSSRPRSSQISACVSKQSSVVSSRKALEDEHESLSKKYADESVRIPCPENWGGVLLVPERFEFWQGQSNRLHDRLIFRKPSNEREAELAQHGWYLERLAP